MKGFLKKRILLYPWVLVRFGDLFGDLELLVIFGQFWFFVP
jgi:hypothetical protein